MTFTTIECSRPGDRYTLFESGPEFDLHLAGSSEHGTGPILCGFDRFARDDDGHFMIGFSVGGGSAGPGVVHHICGECKRLAGDTQINGSNAHLFSRSAVTEEGGEQHDDD